MKGNSLEEVICLLEGVHKFKRFREFLETPGEQCCMGHTRKQKVHGIVMVYSFFYYFSASGGSFFTSLYPIQSRKATGAKISAHHELLLVWREVYMFYLNRYGEDRMNKVWDYLNWIKVEIDTAWGIIHSMGDWYKLPDCNCVMCESEDPDCVKMEIY